MTHAPLPQWIELALPEPLSIGRVVLHTPNLRDYDLQFRMADGSIYQAEVRGNSLDVVDHVLAQPITTLKLRLVARAVRDNASPPRAMVREIEAYATASSTAGGPLTLTRTEAAVEPPAEVVAQTPLAAPLWHDDCSSFRHKPRHYEGDDDAWVLNPSEFSAEYDEQQRLLVCTTTSSAGDASMSRYEGHRVRLRRHEPDFTT